LVEEACDVLPTPSTAQSGREDWPFDLKINPERSSREAGSFVGPIPLHLTSVRVAFSGAWSPGCEERVSGLVL